MELKIKDLLAMEPMKNAEIIAGQAFNDNVIQGVTIMEGPDIADWIKGGEVILTSLYSIRNFTENELKEFIGKLAAKRVSALIIKKFNPEFIEQLLAIGKKYRMPIIELPNSVPFVDVMYPIMGELFNNQVIKLQYYKEIHDRFTALSLAGEGLEKIIYTLEELIGNPVALFDRNFNPIISTYPNLEKFQMVEKVHFYEQTSGIKYPHYRQIVKYPEQKNIGHQIVVPIDTLNHNKMYLLIGENNNSLGELDLIAVENAVTSLSLELMKQFAVAEVEKKYKNDLIEELISGRFQSMEAVFEKANVIGWDLTGAFTTVLFKINRSEDGVIKQKSGLSDRNHFVVSEAIHHYLPNGIISTKSNLFIILWKVEKISKNDKSVINEIKKIALSIQTLIKRQIKDIDVQVGIGNAIDDISGIRKSYREAHDALDLGATLNGLASITTFSELGIFRLLRNIEDASALKQFIPQSLGELLGYQQANHADLLNTLKIFLECNQNAAQTAKQLFVHYKTVVYRLERIKEITGMDFDDSEEMLSVRVGLKIHELIQRKN
ncbi:PucR family transcriptional regulator ligand-binding domain-containing protein [Sporosarcina thermotolerans]|uniref:PucR family transcriptional regulator n=1 Tax=Sporosarcina thermotolerans TaxID=633404 RepID=UPI0024BC1ACD|nr:PucR family transcriptional regulator ligand-binding domain-containing protein [Sporosarcina thermotolerans]WHT49321.1 PucR family transcriptional regulator ligand-binding domain-containing protein [Sporosarcina thermotolerans]